MTCRIAALALAATMIVASAHAAPIPSRPLDPRMRVIDYAPGEIVGIVGTLRTATQILLATGEVIEHVALGDSGGWEVAPEGNVLFLRPLSAAAPTNLIVMARRGAEHRHYVFELTTRTGPIGRGSRQTFFQVRFRYPQDAREDLDRVLSDKARELEQKVLQLKLERGVLEGERNLSYAVQGSPDLEPSEISDNGRFTLLRFPANQPLPALYAVEADGAETLTPFDVRGEFVVVHTVARQLRLRRGREVLCIYNEAFAPYGENLGTGTAARDVRRVERAGGPP